MGVLDGDTDGVGLVLEPKLREGVGVGVATSYSQKYRYASDMYVSSRFPAQNAHTS